MRDLRQRDRQPQQDPPYTPTLDGFQQREREWGHLPEHHIGDRQEAKAPSNEEAMPEAEGACDATSATRLLI